jgi:hypothetical protein
MSPGASHLRPLDEVAADALKTAYLAIVLVTI